MISEIMHFVEGKSSLIINFREENIFIQCLKGQVMWKVKKRFYMLFLRTKGFFFFLW